MLAFSLGVGPSCRGEPMNALTPFIEQQKSRIDQRRRPALRPVIAVSTLLVLTCAGAFFVVRKPAVSQAAVSAPTVAGGDAAPASGQRVGRLCRPLRGDG